jgi:hypothetical protein
MTYPVSHKSVSDQRDRRDAQEGDIMTKLVKLFRLVVLVAVLTLTFSGPAAAGWYDYGTCYIEGENGYYPVSSTLAECCRDYSGYEWIGYGGDYLCERDYNP